MATEVGSLYYDLDIDDKKLKRSLDNADRSVKNLGDNTSKHFGGVVSATKKVVAGLAAMSVAAGVAITAFGVSSVKSFMDSENAAAQLNAVLKSTKGVAGVTATQVEKLATSLQNVTKFSDETITNGQSLLLTFTNIGKDIFPKATETMLDMSQALGQDVKASAIQLGKALQDPILGVTALRRVGVNFSKDQQEVIRKLVETGKSAEAQKLILKELSIEFGGSARAAGNTFAGKLEILKNSVDNVKESLGQVIVEALTPFALQLASFVSSDKFKQWVEDVTQWLHTNLPIALNWLKDTGFPLLKDIIDVTIPILKTFSKAFFDLVTFLNNHREVFIFLVTYLGLIKAALMMQGAVAIFKSGMATASASASGLNATLTFMASSAGGFALVGAAAVAAAIIVTRKWAETQDVINRTKNSIADLKTSTDIVTARMNKLYQQGKLNIEALYRMQQAGLVNTDTASKIYKQNIGGRTTYLPGFANGTDFAPGGWAIVGERGPELVNLPRGSQVTPNHEMGSKTIINLHMEGIMTRSRSELRDIAKDMLSAVNEELRAKGKTELAV